MSHHFTGLSLGPPLGDQPLDLCDLYAFGVPAIRAGPKIVSDAAVSFGPRANVVGSGDCKVAAGSRSDAFFFDFDGIKNLFDTSGNRNFTAPHLGGKSPWTGVDSNLTANVFSMAVELPTAEMHFDPAKPAACPIGRTFTEDVIDIRVAFLTRNEAPPTGLTPHTDTLDRFPYLGDPHPAAATRDPGGTHPGLTATGPHRETRARCVRRLRDVGRAGAPAS